jgi:hypothetical protein
MTLPPPKVCKRIRKLHAQIGSSGKDADVAKQKLSQLLSEHGLTWNDLPTIFAAIEPASPGGSSNDAATGGTAPAAARPEPHVLAVVLRLIEEHIAVTAEERLAAALWILHAHVFDRFSTTPRLALSSPGPAPRGLFFSTSNPFVEFFMRLSILLPFNLCRTAWRNPVGNRHIHIHGVPRA